MWMRYSAVIPAGTPNTAPYRLSIEIPGGVITKTRMRYPPGPRGQVSTAVFQGVVKMFPREGSGWFIGDDEAVESICYIENIAGWEWSIEGFSPNALFDHTVYVDIFILREDVVNPWQTVKDLVSVLKNVIGL